MTTIIVIVVVALVFFVTVCVVAFMVWKREAEMRTDSIKAIEYNVEEMLYELTGETSRDIRRRKRREDGHDEPKQETEDRTKKGNSDRAAQKKEQDPFGWVRVESVSGQPDREEAADAVEKARENITVFEPDAVQYSSFERDAGQWQKDGRRDLKWKEVEEETRETADLQEIELPELEPAPKPTQSPDVPQEPDIPQSPDIPPKPEMPAKPDIPQPAGLMEPPETQQGSEGSASSETWEVSARQMETAQPDTSQALYASQPPAAQKQPEVPEAPQVPKQPEAPEAPQVPKQPEETEPPQAPEPSEPSAPGRFSQFLRRYRKSKTGQNQEEAPPEPEQVMYESVEDLLRDYIDEPASGHGTREADDWPEPEHWSEPSGIEPARPGYNIGKSGRKYTAAELEALIKE